MAKCQECGSSLDYEGYPLQRPDVSGWNSLDKVRIEEIDGLMGEVDALKAQIERLKAPVSVQEVEMLFFCHEGFNDNSGALCDYKAIRPLLKKFLAIRALATTTYPKPKTAEERLEVAEDKLRLIADWCAAYPLEEFPKPNMMEVRALLGDTLLTQLSAYNMRHVCEGIMRHACEGIAKIAAQADGNDAVEGRR